MSVLVKSVEMPKNCEQCRFGYEEDAAWMTCVPQQASFMKTLVNGIRHSDCPLVEVPVPHGDLIDKSQIKVVELEDSVHLMRWERNSEVDFRIEAPTVIEAEGTE